ncbi:PAS domain S-box [Echinicola vietnamensis DSM 17526]|uniref:histidine kinase n=2 Tax=Echinicola TaxID=390846 RepID=L0FWM3_ECHVK|nr:PAS domain S-box [Echinicola vietnamensis DSM 17526]
MFTFRRFGVGEYHCIYQTGALHEFTDHSSPLDFSSSFLCLPFPALEHIYHYLLMERKVNTFLFSKEDTYVNVSLQGNVIREGSASILNILITPDNFVETLNLEWIYDREEHRFYRHAINPTPTKEKIADLHSELKLLFGEIEKADLEAFLNAPEQDVFYVGSEKDYPLFKKHISGNRFYLISESYHSDLQKQPRFIPLKSDQILKNYPKTLFYEYEMDGTDMYFCGDTEQMFGYDEQELFSLSKKYWEELIHPEDRIKRGEKFLKHLQQLESWYRIRHKDGRYIFVHDHIYSYFDEQTGSRRVLGKIKLGSKWKYREGIELKEKYTFKELADCMPDLTFKYHFDKEGKAKISFLSNSPEDTLGVKEDFFKKNLIEIIESIDPNGEGTDGSSFPKVNGKSSDDNTPIMQVLLPNHQIRWLYPKSRPIKNNKNGHAFVCSIVDMTSLKSIEHEAKGLQEPSSADYDYIPLVIFQYDSQGTILKANNTLFQKTQTKDKSKFIGRNIHEIYADSPIYNTLLEGLERGFARYEGPFISFLSKSKYYVGLTVRKLADEESFQAVFEDISEKDFVQRILNDVAAISAHYSDKEFFNQLVVLLSQKLNFTYCLVGEYLPEEQKVKSIAVSKSGKLIPNMDYSIHGTPCFQAINGTGDDNVVIVPNHVAELYPEDEFLREEQLISYCSTGIKDKKGKKQGILVLADQRPIFNQNILINIISILGDRAGAELQRIRYEKELVASQQLYKSIAENFPKGTIDVLDRDLRYIYTEGSEYRHLQINPKSLIGNLHLAKYDPDVAAHAKANLERVFEGETVTYEIDYQGENYKKIGVPLRNEQGEVSRALLVTQNISAYKMAEVEREKLIRDLSSHNEELQHFAYIVSHNLRAPIVNITSLLDLIDEENLSQEENKELFDSLRDSTAILNTTLMDLIEVVSIKKKKLIKVDQINFHNILNNIEKSLFRQLKDAKATIHRDFMAPEINYVYSHLENFLLNFMTNAIKYRHPDRLPEIWICTRMEKDKCRIDFKDNGIGIDLDKYGDRIFGLYQRFHNHVEGKGLGLYLIKEQIRSLDGDITVESTEGEGTTFSVLLKNLPIP